MWREIIDLMQLMQKRRGFIALAFFEAVRGFCLVQGETHGIKLIADGAIGGNSSMLCRGILLLAATVVFSTAAVVVGDYHSKKIAVHTKGEIREKLISTALHNQTPGNYSSGDLLYRLTRDVDDTVQLYRAVHFFIGSFGKVISSLVVGFCLSWQLSVMLLAMGAAKVCVDSVLVKRMQAIIARLKDVEASLAHQIEEHVRGIVPVRVLAVRELVRRQFQRLNRRFAVQKMQQAKVSAGAEAILRLFEFLAVLAVLVAGSQLVLAQYISIGTLTAFIAMYDNLINPYRFIGDFIKRYRTHGTAYRRIAELLDRQQHFSGIQDTPDVPCLSDLRFELVVSGVSFGYTSDRMVLSNVSFSARSGELTYIIGRSGIGKTTLFRILMGFVRPAQGRIYLDTGSQCYEPLGREMFTYISQDAFLFRGSVAENIAFAEQGADMERIMQAAKRAGIHDVIERLPAGYHTIIGDGGRELSGGQKRRLALARAFYRDTPIVLLDEVLASLDNNSAELVQHSIEELCRDNRCVIMISHRREWIPPGANVVELC